MEYARGLKSSSRKEKSREFARVRPGYGVQATELMYTENTRSLISMETISRPVLSICTYTARSAATRWKRQPKRFAAFASSTPVAALHRFCSRQRQRLSTRSPRSCKRVAIIDQRSGRFSVFISKGHSFRKRKQEHNAPSSFRTQHHLVCGGCSNTLRLSSASRSRPSCLELLKRSNFSMLMGPA